MTERKLFEVEATLGQEWHHDDTSSYAREVEPGKRSLSQHEREEIPYGDNPDDLTVERFLSGESGESDEAAEARARFAAADRTNLQLFEGLNRKMIPPEE